MFAKNRHFQIFLIALVCVHFICPLFCATYSQMLCSAMKTERAELDASCCNKANADAENQSDTPTENGTACCLTDIDLVLPINTDIIETIRESAGQHPISTVQLTSILSVSQEQLLNLPSPPKLPDTYLNSVISYRGPPFNRS